MPDAAMACLTCLEQKWEKGIAEYQHEFLRRAVDRKAELRVTKDNRHHVLMYGPQLRTFCGVVLLVKPKIDYLHYTDETLEKVCPLCRNALKSAIESMPASRPSSEDEGMPAPRPESGDGEEIQQL